MGTLTPRYFCTTALDVRIGAFKEFGIVVTHRKETSETPYQRDTLLYYLNKKKGEISLPFPVPFTDVPELAWSYPWCWETAYLSIYPLNWIIKIQQDTGIDRCTKTVTVFLY